MAEKKNPLKAIWNSVKSVPKAALKPIDAGRQKGLTAINPTWQLEKMTELFGPVGVGWTIRYVKEPIVDIEITGEKIVQIDAYIKIKVDGEWSEEVQGFGSGKLVAKESKGYYVDDDVWKKASTDAISNALNKWGVGADVRFKNAEENKYTAPKGEPVNELKPIKPVGEKLGNDEIITKEQAEHLESVLDKAHKKIPDMLDWINGSREGEQAEDITQLTYGEYAQIVGKFKE